MYFKEILRVRTALFWYTLVLVLLTAFVTIVAISSPPDKVTTDSHGNQIVTDSSGAKIVTDKSGDTKVVTDSTGKEAVRIRLGAHKPQTMHEADNIPWVALLGGAGFIAAILATVLGSSLATENEHLEIAWTRPRSRTRYATALMTVDAIGILIGQLLAFAIVAGLIVSLAKVTKLVSGTDDWLNVVRFLLFPLAWYGFIVALSASMRGRASLVQGLIWPIALGLAALAAAPLPDIWHRVFAAINMISPMAYLTYNDHGQGAQIVTGAAMPNIALAVIVLALMIAVSWFAATFQWRRLQA
jgi:hypothetical protein